MNKWLIIGVAAIAVILIVLAVGLSHHGQSKTAAVATNTSAVNATATGKTATATVTSTATTTATSTATSTQAANKTTTTEKRTGQTGVPQIVNGSYIVSRFDLVAPMNSTGTGFNTSVVADNGTYFFNFTGLFNYPVYSISPGNYTLLYVQGVVEYPNASSTTMLIPVYQEFNLTNKTSDTAMKFVLEVAGNSVILKQLYNDIMYLRDHGIYTIQVEFYLEGGEQLQGVLDV